ncbi:hypothetical protein C5167_048764 [Papaver somniferum]|uniref:peroxidase n=1 Tax=Papaver somniferum TaxID=3469 RepID=A0A4Y7KLL5_PAPSO|nr:hypothetical protein C5167_048764 [Papaver somniferum]
MAYYAHTSVALLCILANIFMMFNSNIISVQAQTRVGFYSSSCPRAEAIMRSTVDTHFQSDPTIAPGLLECIFMIVLLKDAMHLSLLMELPQKKMLHLIFFRESGGARWSVPTGRLDGRVSLASDTAELPAFTDSIVDQIRKFITDKGLDIQDLVTLVGAHTIGSASCFTFRYRLYDFNGTGAADPTINPTFLTTLRNLCPANGDGSVRVAMDTGSETRFDQSYYTNLRNGRGVLESDQKLWNDTTTQTFVRRFSGPFRGLSGLVFNVEFGRSMLRLGPACCKAIIDLSETCLPAVFAWGGGILNPTYPNVVKGYCASITAGGKSPPAPFAAHMSPPPPPQVHLGAPGPASVEPPTTSFAIAAAESQPLAPTQLDTVQMPGLFPPLPPGPYNSEIGKCWSTLVDIQGCNAEILNFLFTFAHYTVMAHTSLAFLCILANIFMMLNSNIISVQAQTRVGFYSSSCPRAEAIIRSTVNTHFRSNPTIAPGLLRMHFHDCFVRGCDASILIDGTSTEKTSISNNLIPGCEVIDDAKTQIEAACPNVVSCADILAIAARDSVVVSGGASWSVPTGRLDGRVSIASETAELPRATDSIKGKYKSAHTIGTSACQFFSNRLYNFNGAELLIPQSTQHFLLPCKIFAQKMAMDLDVYYTNLRNGRGVLESDQKLWNDATTQTFVRRFSGPFKGLSGLRFSVEFGRSMVKMSNIEVKTGTQGEIRRICSAIN